MFKGRQSNQRDEQLLLYCGGRGSGSEGGMEPDRIVRPHSGNPKKSKEIMRKNRLAVRVLHPRQDPDSLLAHAFEAVVAERLAIPHARLRPRREQPLLVGCAFERHAVYSEEVGEDEEQDADTRLCSQLCKKPRHGSGRRRIDAADDGVISALANVAGSDFSEVLQAVAKLDE